LSRAAPVRIAGVAFDASTRRYRGARGHFVSDARVREILEAEIAAGAERMRTDAEALRAGRVNLSEWQLRMEGHVKRMHLASASIARGGFAQMNMADLGWTGREVRRQYDYLARFSREIERGYPLDGRFLQRVSLYAEASRGTERQMRRRLAERQGATRERWILSTAEHCRGKGSCWEQAMRGAVPLGRLPRIGSRLCVTRCKCRIMTDADEDWYGEERKAG
jgi:hypothetical protein